MHITAVRGDLRLSHPFDELQVEDLHRVIIHLLLRGHMLQELHRLRLSEFRQFDSKFAGHRELGKIPVRDTHLKLVADLKGQMNKVMVEEIFQRTCLPWWLGVRQINPLPNGRIHLHVRVPLGKPICVLKRDVVVFENIAQKRQLPFEISISRIRYLEGVPTTYKINQH